MKWKSVFNFFHLCTQLYKPPLFQQIEVLLLLYIIIMYTWVCFGFSLLFHLYIWLFLCQYYTDFIVSALSRLTFCNSMYCSPLGSSVRGISQAGILEWLPFPSPGDLLHPGDHTCISYICIAGRFFSPEPLGKPILISSV